MNIDISKKIVVVTGASRGIGRELAKRLAAERVTVVINYFHSENDAKKLLGEISEYNSDCMLVRADVTKISDVKNMCNLVEKKFGKIDVLINNAGILMDNNIQNMKYEQWKEVIDVNLNGTFLCCREFSKIMIEQRYGKIINIGSIKGQVGSAFQVNYSASKAAVIALTKSLAKELGRFNISVNAVCPGFIVTDLNRMDEEKKIIAKNNSLLSIEHSMSDLINCLVFMVSDNLIGVSGRVFNIDSRIDY